MNFRFVKENLHQKVRNIFNGIKQIKEGLKALYHLLFIMMICFVIAVFIAYSVTNNYIFACIVGSVSCVVVWMLFFLFCEDRITQIVNEILLMLVALLTCIKEFLAVYFIYHKEIQFDLFSEYYKHGYTTSDLINTFYIIVFVPIFVLSFFATISFLLRSLSNTQIEQNEFVKLKQSVEKLEQKLNNKS